MDRRNFLRINTLLGVGLVLKGNRISGLTTPVQVYPNDKLLALSYNLLQSWCKGLVSLQIEDSVVPQLNGGILCPACARVHGRIIDAVYPLLFMADKTNNQEYVDAAIKIFQWTEENVSMPDGSWVNDVNVCMWKGTTVFAAIALTEALMHHGHLLDKKTYEAWKERVAKAAIYIYKVFHINFANINYPVTSTYALALMGKFLDNPKYIEKGKKMAHQSLNWFTPKDNFLFGEGRNNHPDAQKNIYHVDLGYNVEESLPALVLYGKLMNDNEVLDVVTRSLKTHAEFMLPDGSWDNSWGTRNFKWTYWGSRTSDGCQPAYALLAQEVPGFYDLAYLNTELLNKCTSNNLLYGGPHYTHHDILPCVHHTFAHSKALATILHHANEIAPVQTNEKATIPREKEYGVKKFDDIKTWLISKGEWKGTVTAYDINYRNTGGHVSGGALSMLWHKKVGPIVAASMVRYQLWENMNMQMEKGESYRPLTPRFETVIDGVTYTNLCDFNARVTHEEHNEKIVFYVSASLVDEKQHQVPSGPIRCDIFYEFYHNKLVIKAGYDSTSGEKIVYALPLISPGNETYEKKGINELEIQKGQETLRLKSNSPLVITQTNNQRIFNFVPGMQAIPVEIQENNFEVEIII